MVKEVSSSRDYELVPEHKFHVLAEKVNEIAQNPLISAKSADKLHNLMEASNSSILSLLEVLQSLNHGASLDETEDAILTKHIKPLTSAVHEVKAQNETIANGMVNIIDRLNDMSEEIKNLRDFVTPKQRLDTLPPLSGGPAPPTNSFDMSSNNSFDMPSQSMSSQSFDMPADNSMSSMPPPMMESNLPPPMGEIPPMRGTPEKRKGLFGK
jgi:hypothetical protein